MPDLITSHSNPQVKRLRSLADRRHRRREGVFLVEGLQPVWRAVESGFDVEQLVVAPELLRQPDALAMVERERAAGTRVLEVSRDVFSDLTDRDGPTGLAASVRIPRRTLADVVAGPGALVVGLERVANPGNLGTVVRAADAAGAAGVVLMGECTDPWSPAAVKASMGSVFAVPVVATTTDAGLAWARGRGLRVLATSGYAATDLWDVDLAKGSFVLLGNEGDGLAEATLAAADERVRIPMTGTAESLNLAVAASVVLFEAARQRRQSMTDPPSLHTRP